MRKRRAFDPPIFAVLRKTAIKKDCYSFFSNAYYFQKQAFVLNWKPFLSALTEK